MDVDDEYWHDPCNPERSWKQPKGKPSNVSCFIAQMKLSRIVEIAVRTLYGTNKYGSLAEFWGEQDWDRDVVQELDSALNKWLDEIPEFCMCICVLVSPSDFTYIGATSALEPGGA